MNSPSALNTDALQTKITKLETEVGERQAEISLAHDQRDAAVASAEQKIQDAISEQNRLIAEKAQRLSAAEDVAAKGRALIASGEKQLAESRRMVQEAETMDLGRKAVEQAKLDLISVRTEWNNKLGQLQDGHTRRKLAELEKLKRRLASKEERRDGYGTEQLRNEEAARKEKQAEKEDAAREYTLGMSGVRRMQAAR